MLEEALQIAEEKREVKSKVEGERYTQLNAEFQRIARRDKKAFFNEQCKEIEENNRMGKTRDLFKKIGDTNGTVHARMGMMKNRNSKDLIRRDEEEMVRIHRRTIQNGLNDPDNHDGVVTHLEPDILECEVKWALGSIMTNKTRGGDGILAELFTNP